MSTARGVVVALRVIGVTGVLLAVAATSASLATSLASTSERSTTTAEAGVRVLEVRIDAGTVDVVRGGDQVRVEGDARGSWRLPSTSSRRVGDRLVLTGECGWSPVEQRCRTSFAVQVPDDVELVLAAETGEVLVDGGTGPVTATISAGGITMTDLESQVVRATGAAGGLSLDFAAAPRQVVATTSTGGVEVILPDDGTAYDVTAVSDVGAAETLVPNQDGATRRITATASVGAVSVRTASP